MRNMHRPAPAPVTVFRPDAAGNLVVSAVVQPTEYRLIAIQETGEEMLAGYASNRTQALDRKYACRATPNIATYISRKCKMIETYEVIELPINEVIEIFGLD